MNKKLIAGLIGIVLAGCEKPEEVEKRAVAPTVIFPPERMATWKGNVGVPGGIPNRTTVFKTLSPSGGDDGPVIVSALNACPAGQVVKLSEGTFTLASSVSTQSKNNFTLRGAGQGKTVFKVTVSGPPFYSRGIQAWPPPSDAEGRPITAGMTKGSTVITMVDTSNLPVGQNFTISPRTPTWAHYLTGTDANYMLGGQYNVKSTTTNTVTFDPPLPFDYSGMSPVAFVEKAGSTTVQGVGYEGFTIDMSGSSAGWAIQMERNFGGWVYDVEIIGPLTRVMYTSGSCRLTYAHNYFHDARGTGPNHEGMDFSQTSWMLIEDNIFNHAGAPNVVWENGSCRSVGNVIAYNYCINTEPGFWDISINHGPHNMLCLVEGNVFHWYKDDGYYGSSSHVTLLRNRIDWQIALKHFSTYYNVVGNVLGTTGENTVYESSKAGIYESSIYELGYPNIGNVSFTGTFGPQNPPNYVSLPNTLNGTQQQDLNVKSTLIRHGNWDSVNNAVIWDSTIADRNIPLSLLYDTAPVWWTTGLRWPPIGADLQPMIGKIPAQVRYENMGKPATPTPTVTATPQPTPTATATPNVTPSPVPSPSPTSTATAAPSPTIAPTPAVLILQPGQSIYITVPTPSP